MKALMVDVDGVVVVHPEPGGWSTHLERDLGVGIKDIQARFFAPNFADSVHGRAALRDRLAPVLAELAPHLTCEQFCAYWFKNDSHLDFALLEQLAALRADGVALHLATVQEHERAAYLWNEMRLKDRFDAIHYAADLGHAKPAPGFYAEIEARTGFAPGDIFFIDDKPENVEAARARGWRAQVWTGRERLADVLSR